MKKWGVGLVLLPVVTSVMAKDIQPLSISYDLVHELHEQYNKAFNVHWRQRTGDNMVIRQSHGGSGRQATLVINDIEADVVTLALAYSMGAITERGWIDREWIKRLSGNSAPYTPTIVFLVRKGNSEQIHDWDNLIKPNVSVITPSSEGSDGARWNYLAARGYALHHSNNDQVKAQDFVRALYKNAEVLDSGTRGSTNTFAGCGTGDVLIVWESGALLAANELGEDKFEIVTPNESTLAEPTVSVIDKVVEEKGTKEVVEAYLKYPYPSESQEIAAKNYHCLRDAEVAKKYGNAFPKLKLFIIGEEFGGWTRMQKEHFANGGTFDQTSKH